MCCTGGGGSVGRRGHAGALQRRNFCSPDGAEAPGSSMLLSSALRMVIPETVVDESVMVHACPSGSVPSHLQTTYSHRCGNFLVCLRHDRFVDPAYPRFAILLASQRVMCVGASMTCVTKVNRNFGKNRVLS